MFDFFHKGQCLMRHKKAFDPVVVDALEFITCFKGQ